MDFSLFYHGFCSILCVWQMPQLPTIQNVYTMLVACLSSIVVNLKTFDDIFPPTLAVLLLTKPQNKVIFRSEQDLLHMSDVCSDVMPWCHEQNDDCLFEGWWLVSRIERKIKWNRALPKTSCNRLVVKWTWKHIHVFWLCTIWSFSSPWLKIKFHWL